MRVDVPPQAIPALVALGLLYEHQQLKSLLSRSDMRERRSCSKVAIWNELACRHGLTALKPPL